MVVDLREKKLGLIASVLGLRMGTSGELVDYMLVALELVLDVLVVR